LGSGYFYKSLFVRIKKPEQLTVPALNFKYELIIPNQEYLYSNLRFPSLERRGKSLFPELCRLEEMADQVRHDGSSNKYFAKNERTGIGENCAKNNKKWDMGRVTRKVETRLIASLHHLTTCFLQALIFRYFCIKAKVQTRKKQAEI
jgi:hypothetical protein